MAKPKAKAKMEATFTLKKVHVWAAGAILLLLTCIVVAILFIRYRQLSDARKEIKETIAIAEKHEAKAKEQSELSAIYEAKADSLTTINDSLTSQILVQKERIKIIQNEYVKDVAGYRLLNADERLALFSRLIED